MMLLEEQGVGMQIVQGQLWTVYPSPPGPSFLNCESGRVEDCQSTPKSRMEGFRLGCPQQQQSGVDSPS